MCIEVRRFIWDFLDSNMYVIKDGARAIVIDPVDNDRAFEFLKNLEHITVLLTHEHFDHISGLNRIREEYSCVVIAQEQCSLRICDEKKNLSAYADIMVALSNQNTEKKVQPFVCKAADITFQEIYKFEWAGRSVSLYSTPGHSPGSACVVIQGRLFSGDSLLEQGAMNRFPGGSERDYREKTLPLMRQLLNNSESVFPGHGDERRSEIFLDLITTWA